MLFRAPFSRLASFTNRIAKESHQRFDIFESSLSIFSYLDSVAILV